MKIFLRHIVYAICGFLFATISNSPAWAQDSLAHYHPLGKGNIWIYKISRPEGTFYYKRLEVKSDSTIDGKYYRIIAETNTIDLISRTSVERYDVSTGCYFTRSGNADILQDSTFTSAPNTSIGGNFNNRVFERLDKRTVFDAQIPTRQITEGHYLSKEDVLSWSYSYGLGLVYAEDLQLVNYIPAWMQTLIYAKIDGIEYGKIPLKVEDRNIELPASIVLSQNYPNPFNPSTTISFSLPARLFVSIKIFDVIGRDVSTLVSEEFSAGTHTRDWNASAYPSGVYFYRLQAGSYTETKCLVLLR
jgi:hypothetical protein